MPSRLAAIPKGIRCLVLLGAGIGGPMLAYLIEYLRGQDVSVVPIPILFPLALLALEWLPFLVGPSLIVAAVAWYRQRTFPLIVLIGLGLTMLGLPLLSRSYRIATDPFLLGYLAKAKRESDLPVLRRWAEEQIRAAPRELSPATIPQGAAPRGFRFAAVVPQGESREPHVKLATGGHFAGFWGLRVGGPTFRCGRPPSEREVAPGVCVWWQDESEFGLDN